MECTTIKPKKMKIIVINLNDTEKAILTFSKLNNSWDLFSGNINLLKNMAVNAGWNYQQTHETLPNWVAKNKHLFVHEVTELSTYELWSD